MFPTRDGSCATVAIATARSTNKVHMTEAKIRLRGVEGGRDLGRLGTEGTDLIDVHS